jgi:hypothetical protein
MEAERQESTQKALRLVLAGGVAFGLGVQGIGVAMFPACCGLWMVRDVRRKRRHKHPKR